MKQNKISKILLLCVLTLISAGSASLFGQDDLRSKLKLIADKNPDIKMMGVYFNAESVQPDQIPNLVGQVTVIKIPLQSLRDVSQTLNQMLDNYDVQAIFLMDDGKKLVTNSRTVKYIVKMGLKKNLMTFSDAENLDVKVSGRIAMKGGKLGLELADDQ